MKEYPSRWHRHYAENPPESTCEPKIWGPKELLLRYRPCMADIFFEKSTYKKKVDGVTYINRISLERHLTNQSLNRPANISTVSTTLVHYFRAWEQDYSPEFISENVFFEHVHNRAIYMSEEAFVDFAWYIINPPEEHKHWCYTIKPMRNGHKNRDL